MLLFKVEHVLLYFLRPVHSRRGWFLFPTVAVVGRLYFSLKILVLWIDCSEVR